MLALLLQLVQGLTLIYVSNLFTCTQVSVLLQAWPAPTLAFPLWLWSYSGLVAGVPEFYSL